MKNLPDAPGIEIRDSTTSLESRVPYKVLLITGIKNAGDVNQSLAIRCAAPSSSWYAIASPISVSNAILKVLGDTWPDQMMAKKSFGFY